MSNYQNLAGYRKCVQRTQAAWPAFLQQRASMLSAQERFGKVAEKVAENIVGALLTTVLDWQERDLNWQLGRADLVVTHNFTKYLVVETKRPGSLSNRTAVDNALVQASRYAHEQHVKQVAVSDGILFFAADIVDGGWSPRVVFDLAQEEAPVDALWWVSMDGVHRPCEVPADLSFLGQPGAVLSAEDTAGADQDALLHPKYQIPARCFAYVGNPSKTSTWKLPYLLADGSTDLKRLPKAIQSLSSNYRGAKVGGIPDEAIPYVFRRLAGAATAEGKMPASGVTVAPAYQMLADILQQMELAGV
ncbi:MAG: hypothetical protein ACYCR3_02715 [Acidithiobacillus sp.]|jgi:hypothetical protein